MRSATVLLCVFVASVAAACGSPVEPASPTASESVSSAATPTEAARPTLTDPALQPPSQDNQYTRTTGRPKVVFDPCTWVADAEVESVGFSGSSRRRGPDLVAEYTFLTCTFRNAENTLSLGMDSGNITWDEDLAKNGAWLELTTINGRQAGLMRGNPAAENDCSVHLRTQAGVAIVWTDATSLGRRQNLDPCANIMEIASVVEKSIGKEN